MFPEKKIINFFKTSIEYQQFVLQQSTTFESKIFSDQIKFDQSFGVKVMGTPKFYYNFYSISKIAFNGQVFDYSDQSISESYCDSLFETGISVRLNEKENKQVFLGGHQQAYEIHKEEKYLFLDRDGVINHDSHYPSSTKDIVIYSEIFKIARLFAANDYKIVVVTNQSGIARGIFGPEALMEIEQHINQAFKKEELSIYSWLYCPYHKDGTIKKFAINSFKRKPMPGMILKFMHSNLVDLSQSLMIGDKHSDHLSILNLKTKLIKGHYPLEGDYFNSHLELFEYFQQEFSAKKT